ncbi:MAG: NADH-quinone oxidoreductase subunit L, partial [Desulfovibrionaceae bacterium]
MLETLIFFLVVFPFLAALGCYFLRVGFLRTLIVLGTGAIVTLCSLLMIGVEPFSIKPPSLLWISTDAIVSILDFVLLFILLYYGFRLRNNLIKFLIVFQIVVMGWLELFMVDH